MKPILLIAFLALGPALADQFQAPTFAAAPLTDAMARHASADAPTAPLAEHTWLCGR
ncbi:MAG TPA: hypothetical protein VGD37_01240 [Kofleriaceae bacterium]